MRIWWLFYVYLVRMWSVFDEYLVSIRSVFDAYWSVFDAYLIQFDQYLMSIWWLFNEYLMSLWSVFDENLMSIRCVLDKYLTSIWSACYLILSFLLIRIWWVFDDYPPERGISVAFLLQGSIWFSYILLDLILNLKIFVISSGVGGGWWATFWLFKSLDNNMVDS